MYLWHYSAMSGSVHELLRWKDGSEQGSEGRKDGSEGTGGRRKRVGVNRNNCLLNYERSRMKIL